MHQVFWSDNTKKECLSSSAMSGPIPERNLCDSLYSFVLPGPSVTEDDLWIPMKSPPLSDSREHWWLTGQEAFFPDFLSMGEPTLRCLLSAAASWDSMRSCMFLHCFITTLRIERGFVHTGCFSLSFFSFSVSKSLWRAIRGSLMLYFP